MKIFYFILFFVIAILNAYDDILFHSVTCAGSLSHTGYALIPSAELNWKSHSLYLGPKLPVSGRYIAGDHSYGFDLGYKYFFTKEYYKNNLNFFLVLDYQLISYQQQTRFKPSEHNNYIHEIHIGYGIQIRIFNRFFLGNSIAIGKYWESYFNNYKSSRVIFEGYANNIKIFITYIFNEN